MSILCGKERRGGVGRDGGLKGREWRLYQATRFWGGGGGDNPSRNVDGRIDIVYSFLNLIRDIIEAFLDAAFVVKNGVRQGVSSQLMVYTHPPISFLFKSK